MRERQTHGVGLIRGTTRVATAAPLRESGGCDWEEGHFVFGTCREFVGNHVALGCL